MKYYNIVLLIISATVLFTACEKTIIIDLPDPDPVLNIQAFFENGDETLEVWVSRNKSAGDASIVLDSNIWEPDRPPLLNTYWIADATVELYKNGTLMTTFYGDAATHTYRADLGQAFVPQPNDVYELKVSAPDFPDAVATHIHPNDLELLDYTYDSTVQVPNFNNYYAYFENDIGDKLTVRIKDEVGAKNYYQINAYTQIAYPDIDGNPYYTSSFVNSIVPENATIRDELSQTYYWGYGNGCTFSDQALEDQTKDLGFYVESFENEDSLSDTLYLAIGIASEDYYLYQKSFQEYQASGDFFSEPALLYSNVDGGHGLFITRTIHRKILAIE